MKARWEDLATRVHGLATHFLDAHDLEALAAATDLGDLCKALRGRGFQVEEGAVTAEDLELAIRRTAAARLLVLTRWAGSRNPLLAMILEDEDRRSLRAILRGAVQHVPAELRLAGLIPTPELPERALVELSRQPTPRAVAALLTSWGNVYGAELGREMESAEPDLLAIEYALNRTFAARALRGARAARNRLLVEQVRLMIDVENACAALVLVGSEAQTPAKRAFVEGGHYLSLAAFLDAVATDDAGRAGRRLAIAFRPTGLAQAFERWGGDATTIEHRLLRYRIAVLKDSELANPAGPAPILGFALRLRLEALELRRLIWGIALGAPSPEVAGSVVAG